MLSNADDAGFGCLAPNAEQCTDASIAAVHSRGQTRVELRCECYQIQAPQTRYARILLAKQKSWID